MFPPGARPIPDPEAEMERLAAARNQGPAVLCETIIQVDEPGKPGEHFWVRATVTALDGKQRPVKADISGRVAEAVRESMADE